MKTVSARRRRSDGTWVLVAQGKQPKVVAPDMVDILEALEMNRPYSSPVDSSWTLKEHLAFERGLRMRSGRSYEGIAELIQTKTAAQVESYGTKCWQSGKYQRFVARRQRAEQEDREVEERYWANVSRSDAEQPRDEIKVETEEMAPPANVEPPPPPVRRHRVRKWLRWTLRWCIDALSFRCLRRHNYCAAEKELGADLPTNDLTPSRDERVDTAFYGFVPVPIRGPAFRRVESQSPAPLRPRPRYRSAPSVYHRRAPPGDLCAPPQPRALIEFGALDADEDDDWVMRTARQAAAEIDWYESVTETAPVTREPKKNSGAWSKDEHERYCAGLEKYRYGSWKLIAEHVGTRTERQVMSHAQSIRAKRKRAEERDQQPHSELKTRVALHRAEPHKSSRTATSSTPSAMVDRVGHIPTPEELLMVSLLGNAGQIDNAPTLANNHLDATTFSPMRVKLGVDFSFREDGDERSKSFQDASGKERESDSIRESFADKCSDKQPRVDPDSPLCSPPPDVLRVSTLSDERLLDLLDIPPTQAT